jgi:hypothetical protein
MLRSSSAGVLVNKNAAPNSRALFTNDLIETPKNVVARIEANGSTAEINAETMVQFEGDELVLDHGSLLVNTTRGLRVRVGCLTVTPVNPSDWTHYDVTDLDGKVTVSALKSDVYLDARDKNSKEAKNSSQSNREIVREGEQKSRTEKCGVAYIKADRIPGIGAMMNSIYAKVIAGTAVGVIACFGLCPGGDPISPDKP